MKVILFVVVALYALNVEAELMSNKLPHTAENIALQAAKDAIEKYTQKVDDLVLNAELKIAKALAAPVQKVAQILNKVEKLMVHFPKCALNVSQTVNETIFQFNEEVINCRGAAIQQVYLVVVDVYNAVDLIRNDVDEFIGTKNKCQQNPNTVYVTVCLANASANLSRDLKTHTTACATALQAATQSVTEIVDNTVVCAKSAVKETLEKLNQSFEDIKACVNVK